jgi:hypothetical protein
MSIESTTQHNDASAVQASGANARLALRLVALVVGIFLVTLWKFRPI